MKSILSLTVCLVLLYMSFAVSGKETIYVVDVTNHGLSSPEYTGDKEFDVTGNRYPYSNGQLTEEGMKQLFNQGKEFRREYVDKQRFMPKNFDPETIYLHSANDQSSLMSAYAWTLGAYGDSVSFLDFKDRVSGSQNAVGHEKKVRTGVGLSETPSRNQKTKVPIHTENGFLYWENAAKECPGLYRKIQSNVKAASQSINEDFSFLGKTFGKDPKHLDFNTTHYYLDDYQKAQALGKTYPTFQNQHEIDSFIQKYEREYYNDGLLGGNYVERVISGPFLSYLITNTFAQSENKLGKIHNSRVEKLKHSHFFSKEVAFASLLKNLGHSQASAPTAGQNVRFEVYEEGGKHYVKTTIDGRPLNFGGSRNGVLDIETFYRTLYPKLYFGSVNDVCRGREDITKYILPRCSDYRNYLSNLNANINHLDHKSYGCQGTVVRPVIKERVQKVVRPQIIERVVREPPKERIIEVPVKEVVEVQVPSPPKVVVETKVVEKPVPIVEEKVVVKEAERLVAEKPTHIHHIEIEQPDKPTGLPINFHEEIPEDSGWPWWLWLLPLLCCIPLIAWLLCRKPKQAPVVRAKQPVAPVGAKRLQKPKEREIMAVKTEERHSPERKYVIERKVVDEAEDIEQEITRELQKSRVVRESQAQMKVSGARQTASAIAAESAYSRGSGGGRKKRIKTIKKYGQIIGKEEQIVDADGNVISSKKIGLDEDDYYSGRHGSVGGEEVVSETYTKKSAAAQSSTAFGAGGEGGVSRSRRGYSSGRHEGGLYGAEEYVESRYVGPNALDSRVVDTGYREGIAVRNSREGANVGRYEDEEYGHYSPGGRRYSRASRGGSQERRIIRDDL